MNAHTALAQMFSILAEPASKFEVIVLIALFTTIRDFLLSRSKGDRQ